MDFNKKNVVLLLNMKNIASFIILSFFLLVGCQTSSNISPHYSGARMKPIASSRTVTLEKMPSGKKFLERGENLGNQGFTMLGKALFTGLQDGPEEIKAFAASIGADFVLSRVVLVGTTTQSYMGLDSYTPGRTVTSYGSATAYATGTNTGSITTPYGPMGFNSQSTGTAYGSGTSSTYIPAQATYSPRYYEVPITEQAYAFWQSPQGYLRNWRQEWDLMNSSKPTTQQAGEEEMKLAAMYFAQSWNLVLPNNLRPTVAARVLSPEEKRKFREFWITRNEDKPK